MKVVVEIKAGCEWVIERHTLHRQSRQEKDVAGAGRRASLQGFRKGWLCDVHLPRGVHMPSTRQLRAMSYKTQLLEPAELNCPIVYLNQPK